MRIGFEAALGVHPDALTLRGRRTEVLANNLANADTPNFKARDIDFKAAMAAQTEASEHAGRLRTTHANHLEPAAGALDAELMYRNPTLPSLDGNTVDSHTEQAQFADNQVQFLAALRFLDGRFMGMTTAIQGE